MYSKSRVLKDAFIQSADPTVDDGKVVWPKLEQDLGKLND